MSAWTVDHCWFGDALTGYGIRSTNNVENHITDCRFNTIPEKGIYFVGSASGDIIGNYFYAAIAGTEANGWAITLNGVGCANTIVMGNYASQHGLASADGGNNPYLDTSTGTAITSTNAWSDNWDGNDVAAPAVTV